MAAFLIMTREKTRDPDAFAGYAKLVAATLEGHDATFVARQSRYEVLEGAATESVVIMSFPSFEKAKSWYDSPAYVALREGRFKCSDFRCILVEGN
jgi:uncharacterized protein (DUF1330 family)